MLEERIHIHPRHLHGEMYGQKLEPGDTIAQGDVYNCSDGTWQPCHPNVFGTPVLTGMEIVFIRPRPVFIFGQAITT